MKLGLLFFLGFFLTPFVSQAACTMSVTVSEAITASTADYLERAQNYAQEKKCDSLFVRLNTPGGSLQSTRLIVERMLASPIPYLCLITPQGAHAGSAGAIILQACHISGGVEATNLGAATPILGGGQEMGEDLRKKMINDTVSWLEGVTTLRGRNLQFSKDIVTEAKAVSTEEAVKIKALDILAKNEADFLSQAQGLKVRLADKSEHSVAVGDLLEFSPDVRHRILSFVADPEFAYLLFMGSLGLLYVELTHPGLIAPGVIGGIGLVLSLVAFHKLDVAWGGLALILIGVVFLVLEIFVTSFGALALGGLIALFMGSVFLFDTQSTGYSLPYSLIFSVVGVIAVVFLAVGFVTLKTLRFRSKDNDMDLQAAVGVVSRVEEGGLIGQVMIIGETWAFKSNEKLEINDQVRVLSRQGLTLTVTKI